MTDSVSGSSKTGMFSLSLQGRIYSDREGYWSFLFKENYETNTFIVATFGEPDCRR